jgi:hypothetical protein
MPPTRSPADADLRFLLVILAKRDWARVTLRQSAAHSIGSSREHLLAGARFGFAGATGEGSMMLPRIATALGLVLCACGSPANIVSLRQSRR